MTAAQPFIAWWPITDEDRPLSELIFEATDLRNDDNDLMAVAIEQGCIPTGERTWRLGQGQNGPILTCHTWAIPFTATTGKEPAA